jgi:hypothetical protein
VHQDFSNANVKVPTVSNKVSYIDAKDASESYSVSLEDQKSDKKESCSRSIIPAIINVSKSEKFYSTGVVLCLNQGKLAGISASEDVLPEVQISLSQIDSFFNMLWSYDLCLRDKNFS